MSCQVSWLRLADAADRLAGGGTERLGDGTGSVGGAVVDHQDLDGAGIVLAGDTGDRLLDPLGLVPGGDQHRGRGGRMRPAQWRLAVQQQAERRWRLGAGTALRRRPPADLDAFAVLATPGLAPTSRGHLTL
jgi:hypothetical protein